MILRRLCRGALRTTIPTRLPQLFSARTLHHPVERDAPIIYLIHALRESEAPIQDAFERLWPEARTVHLMDVSISRDWAVAHEKHGDDAQALDQVRQRLQERFLDLSQLALQGGAHALQFTCSAFPTMIDRCGEFAAPVRALKPDEGMLHEALAVAFDEDAAAQRRRMVLVATFQPTLDTVVPYLHDLRPGVDVVPVFVDGALAALKKHDGDEHDRLVAEAVAREQAAHDGAVVMLAQFSMARAAPLVREELARVAPQGASQVLTSPDSAVTNLRRLLGW